MIRIGSLLLCTFVLLVAAGAHGEPTQAKGASSRARKSPLTVLQHAGSAHGYLLIDEHTRAALMVDAPTGAAQRFLPEIAQRELKLSAIVLTHLHGDHVADLGKLWRATGAGVVLYRDAAHAPVQAPSGPQLHAVTEGDVLAFGKQRLEVMHVPGHSGDSIALWARSHRLLFAGDTVQAGGYGGSLADPRFLDSMSRIADLPPETQLLAGHGARTTVGDEAGWMRSMVESEAQRLLSNPSEIVTPGCNCGVTSLFGKHDPMRGFRFASTSDQTN